jgi:hypothetical protein
VVWLRELQPAALPAAVPRVLPARASVRPVSTRPAPARIEAGPEASQAPPQSPPALATAAPETRAEVEEPPPPSAPLPAAAAASAVPFEWPESTRLRYVLTGQVRGEVHGRAQVEWIRAGARYQVHMDIVVGVPFAPMFTRRMSSDGELGDTGLKPIFYDEETKVAFREPRRVTIRFEPGAVWLPGGPWPVLQPDVQDSASQFVQLAYLFALDPERLQPGRRIELALALPRRVAAWVYEARALETVHTPIGAIEAHRMQPVLPPGPGELAAEAWFAPGLRYLPVRIRIRQDESTWLDLVIDRLPELGAATSAAFR